MKKIVFTFGRFTPPTIGHAKLINKVVEYAKKIGADNRIYTSKTFDTSKNPIPYKDKVSFLRELFPNATIADDPNAHTGFHVAKILSDEGYRDVTMVVGSDRVEEFRTKIGKYIKDRNDPSFDPKKHYSFDKFTVVSAGERDPDAQGVEGMSGTKMREAVRNNDFKTFASGIPSKNAKLLRKIYNTVKKNLNEDINLVEEIDHKKFGPMLDSFTDFASKKLGIKSMPNIELSKEDLGKSFGGYNPAMKSIVVVSKNRHPMDIFRTVAHELVHHKQNEDGRIGKDISNEGATGSDIENEANSEAGKIMRWFAKTNPEIFKSGYVIESADLTEGLNDPSKLKAVFLAGGPGSGKDFVMNRTLKGHGLTEINSDIAFEHLMRKSGLDFKMPESEREERDIVRGRAKNITKEQQRLALAGRRGVIINGTADDPEKIAHIKNELEKNGYETKMLFVNTSNEVSRQRNLERGKLGGRKVPDGTDDKGVPNGSPDIRSEKWNAAQEAKEKMRSLFGDEHFIHVDNSDDYRTVSKNRKKQIDDEHLSLFNHYRQFTSAPVASEKGQEWVESEKAKRGVSDYKPAKSTKVSQKPAKPAPYQPNASELEQARRLGVQHLGDGQFGVGDKRQSQVTHVSKNGQLVMSESLHDWFNKSKSKDGKKGWVQVGGRYDGKPCARQPGQTTTPKCRSSSEAASMTKKEKQYAFKKKNREDPNQPEKSGAAKPKMVKTYKDQQESVSMDEKTLQEKKDACYSKVKARYKVWPSAYASGALVRCRKVGADNWGNKSKVDENFENFVAEEGGAGEWGTDKLRKRYEKDTPGQGKKENKKSKKLIQDDRSPPLGYEFGNNSLGPTFGVLRSPTGLGYGYSIPMSESVKSWMENERTIARFKQRYGELAEQKLIETANMLNEMEFEKSMPKHFGKLREAWEAMAGRDMGTVPKQGKEEVQEEDNDGRPVMPEPVSNPTIRKIGREVVSKALEPLSLVGQGAHEGDAKKIAAGVVKGAARVANVAGGLPGMAAGAALDAAADKLKEDWQKVNRQDKTDGLSQAAVDAYRRENPGSKLQTAVTEKNPKGKRAKRRLSFCRRMKGMKKRLTSAETARDPDSRINKALRRWNCEE